MKTIIDKKELTETINNKIESMFLIKGIESCNYSPHPFTIGPKLVAYGSDHNSGFLDEQCILNFEKQKNTTACSFEKCNTSYQDHKYDRVLFLQLKMNLKKEEAQNCLKGISDILENNEIDGICFVETEEKFRIE